METKIAAQVSRVGQGSRCQNERAEGGLAEKVKSEQSSRGEACRQVGRGIWGVQPQETAMKKGPQVGECSVCLKKSKGTEQSKRGEKVTIKVQAVTKLSQFSLGALGRPFPLVLWGACAGVQAEVWHDRT